MIFVFEEKTSGQFVLNSYSQGGSQNKAPNKVVSILETWPRRIAAPYLNTQVFKADTLFFYQEKKNTVDNTLFGTFVSHFFSLLIYTKLKGNLSLA